MASSANPGPLTAENMSALYFQFYSFPPETINKIFCLKFKTDHKFSEYTKASQKSLGNIAKSYIMENLKVTYEAGSFGRYLARDQTDLVELKKAIKIDEEMGIENLAMVEQMKDEKGHKLYPHHPARTENSEVWKAAVAQVIENFAALRVPVNEQLVLYCDFHGVKLEAIHAILILKGLSPPSKWDEDSKKDLEDLIAKAKGNFEEKGGQIGDARSLGEYFALGQVSIRFKDLNKATTLSSEETEKVAHLEKIDGNHKAHPSNSMVNRIAETQIADNMEHYQA